MDLFFLFAVEKGCFQGFNGMNCRKVLKCANNYLKNIEICASNPFENIEICANNSLKNLQIGASYDIIHI